MAKIAVIGAAGFVGMELVNLLEGRGHNVVAIARYNGRFLLQRNKCEIIHPDTVSKRNDIDVVINLAYPNSGSVHHYSTRNKEILRMIRLLADEHARIIHASTIAVFGFQLDHPIVAEQVFNRRDYLYVESKIELENLLLNTFPKDRLSIVRLGNVWGKKSASWTAPLIDKLLFGVPIGSTEYDGYSNITDVANVVSYLTFLAEKGTSSEMLFHHLAELGETRWSYWIQKICSVINTQPIYISHTPPYPSGMGEEISAIFNPMKPRTVYKKLVFGRYTGSLMHSLIGMFPEEYFTRKKQQHVQPVPMRKLYSDSDEVFLWVMSCRNQFVSVTDPGWEPALDKEQSWQQVLNWMHEVGYVESISAA